MQRQKSETVRTARRGGAVIVVVLALLTSLMFIGLFFYNLSDSELGVATSFANSPDQVIDPDVLGDFALQQVIVGVPAQFRKSAIGGGQVTSGGDTLQVSDKSLVAHIIGLVTSEGVPADARPRNGRGIGVFGTGVDANGLPVANDSSEIGFDVDGNGTPDFDGSNFRINLSSLANDTAGFLNPFERVGNPFEFSRPDVDYTYPDINSLFLAYDSTIEIGGTTYRILIPSYFRPQLFPDKRGAGFGDLYTDPQTAPQVLRPHAEHAQGVDEAALGVDFNQNGSTDAPYSVPRYLTTAAGTVARSGDRNRIIGPFPFATNINGVTDNEMGVFAVPLNATTPYELDVDADGDGTLDSIWLDLGHPLVDLADGRQAVPMFYVKIIDADGLLNVNYHGQDPLITELSNNGLVDPFTHIYSMTGGWIHASHLGTSAFEVNPLPALRADPNDPAYLNPADLDAATKQHQGWYSGTGATAGFTRVQMANTELARLLHGGGEFLFDLSGYANTNPGSDIAGRYGEIALIRPALTGGGPLPSAGNTQFDDDGDDNDLTNDGPFAPGDNFATGVAHEDAGILMPRSIHPLDFSGLGNYEINGLYPALGLTYTTTYNVIGGTGGTRDLGVMNGPMSINNPSRWLQYGYETIPGSGVYDPALWASQGSGEDANLNGMLDANENDGPLSFPLDNADGVLDEYPDVGRTAWLKAGGAPNTAGTLQRSDLPVGTAYTGLFNEADEIVTDSNFPTADDAPFPTSEMAALQLSDQQWQLIRENSRLRKLLSFNFEANKQAAAIRGQFATDTRDRVEHGHTRAASANRQWEFNDVDPVTTLRRFPPAFGGGTFRSSHESLNINLEDPFRPVTRRLLAVEENNPFNIGATRSLPGQKLNLNRLLVNFDRQGNPIYRHLVPHAMFTIADNTPGDVNQYLGDGTGPRPVSHAHPNYTQSYYDLSDPVDALDPPIPTVGTFINTIPFSSITTDKFAQEAWARYDRQRLARDIYTLLYTVGGLDTDDITAGPHTVDTDTDGIPDLVEAAAQFAVNYVDALDADDCITRFEFDANLSDGWDTSGTPWAPNLVVYGVEAQQLTFSEVLLVQQAPAATDNAGTLHNENDGSNNEHRWLYVELRNASPFTVPLPTGSYRLARYDIAETARTGTGSATTPIAASMFKTRIAGADYKAVGAGQNFLIGCHDGTVTNALPATSDFYANIDDTTPGFEPIIPWSLTNVLNPSDDPIAVTGAPHLDLDLVVTDTMVPAYSEYYENNPAVPLGVALVEPLPMGDATMPVTFQLRLERRMNTQGFNFGEGPDTWVEVDRIDVVSKPFIPAGDGATDIVTALATLTSRERRQPLDEVVLDYGGVTGAEVRKHSMVSTLPDKHTGNSVWAQVNGLNPAAGFTRWQPHFDRDFSSAYELLSIPLVGPHRLVQDIADNTNGQLSGWSDSPISPGLRIPFAAEGMFRYPDGDTNLSGAVEPGEIANRWYRMFEFVEFPPRTEETIRELLSLRRRTNGRINLNTVRHEHVFAGLIDDLTQLANTSAARPALDQHDAGRNWFEQLLYARDGVDPLSNLPLPGVPGSMPFRSLSYVDPQPNGAGAPEAQLQNTILRKNHPIGGTLENLQLFEARGLADINGNNDIADDQDQVDYHTRNRLLAKIANNSTNRSHVFAMWVGYELFEAHQPNPAVPDVVQIGARIDDLPGHREFVVVDMTRLEEAFIDDPNDVDASSNPVPGRFDFRKFIIYRKRIK